MTEDIIMARRYVYWRTPQGKPYRGNDNKHTPTASIEEIGHSATTGEQDKISWEGFTVERLKLVVRSAIVVLQPEGNELNEADSWSIIWEAMRSVILQQGGHKPLAPTDLLMEADNQAAKYFRRKLTKYFMVSSLSVSELPSPRLKVRECEVLPLSTKHKRIEYPASLKLQAGGTPFAQHLESTNYLPIKVKTSGRSFADGVTKALDTLTLLRGLWTLFAKYRSWSIGYGMTRQRFLEVISTGPVHTLHNADGTTVDDVWWYEPDYSGDRKIFKPGNKWEKIDQFRRRAMRRMASLPYRIDLQDLIIRYTKALDQNNLDVTFLHLWGLLEKITDTVGGSYDETIRRAVSAYLSKDRQFAKDSLESLRCHRNRLVHAAMSTNANEQFAYLIKDFIDPHLMRLIHNAYHVESLKEYGEFLNQPTNLAELEKRYRHLKRAIQLTKGESKSQ